MKLCPTCKKGSPEVEFCKNKRRLGGLNTYCKPCVAIQYKNYYKRNKALVNSKTKKYRDADPTKTRAMVNAHYAKNKDALQKKHRLYYIENKEKILTQSKVRNKYLYQNDPIFKLKHLLRNRIKETFKLKGFRKKQKTMELLGCSINDFKAHIESQFKPGMTWDNYGFKGWHIDHRIPLSSATNETELKPLCHYQNLQPMWWNENLSKNATNYWS